jgi:hypothetical protein
MTNPFTFEYLEKQLDGALECGYEFLTCIGFVEKKNTLGEKAIVMRVDIDESVPKVARILDIFRSRDIKATFFLRLHAEYNPFSFANYSVICRLIDEGHELGYHSEIIDQSFIWGIPPIKCLRTDLESISTMFDVRVQGVASHGGRTGLNNLDFWKTHKPSDFGLVYEAYDEERAFGLFQNSLYISDSEWTQWKCYSNGQLQENDRRSLIEHLKDDPRRVYLLIHPETYFDLHPYE